MHKYTRKALISANLIGTALIGVSFAAQAHAETTLNALFMAQAA
jgi:multiple sugar transport system substrate-binding protein